MRPTLLIVGVCVAVARKDMKEPPPTLNPFFESLLKWWCETMENEADKRCNLLFTHRHISQTNDGTQIRGLSQQLRAFLPRNALEQRDQFKAIAEEFCQTAEKHRSCKDKNVYMAPVLKGAKPFTLPAHEADAASVQTSASATSEKKLDPKPPAHTLQDASHGDAGHANAFDQANEPASTAGTVIAATGGAKVPVNVSILPSALRGGGGLLGLGHLNLPEMPAKGQELSKTPRPVIAKSLLNATAARHGGPAARGTTAAHMPAAAAHSIAAAAKDILAHGGAHGKASGAHVAKPSLDKHAATSTTAAHGDSHPSGGHAPMVAATKASDLPHMANPHARSLGAKEPHDRAAFSSHTPGLKGATHPQHEIPPTARHLHNVSMSETLAHLPFGPSASAISRMAITPPAGKHSPGDSHGDSTVVHDAIINACKLGKNSVSRAACAALPGIVEEYCATLSAVDARSACLAGQKQLQAALAAQPHESVEVLGPAVLGAIVLLMLVGLWALANRKKRPLQLPGCCMQLPFVYALFSHKNRQRKTGDELDAKDGV